VIDRVQTAEFLLDDRISSPTLRARSAYFGEKELQVADLLSLRTLGGSGTFEVTIDAARNGSAPGQWLETNVEVEADTALAVTASGQVDLWQDGTGQYTTGPNGYRGQAGGFVM